jgi:hypothetical protein
MSEPIIKKAQSKVKRGKYPYFISGNTNAKSSIGSNGRGYVLMIDENSGELLIPTVTNHEYQSRSAAEKALQGVADMYVANGVPITWYRSEKK